MARPRPPSSAASGSRRSPILALDWVVLDRRQPDPQSRLSADRPRPVMGPRVVDRRRRRRPGPAGHRRLRHRRRDRRGDHPQRPRSLRAGRRRSCSASLTAAGNLPAVAPWTLTYWVSGWMQFRSHGYVIYHFWVDGFPASVGTPSVLTGLAGLIGVIALAAAIAIVVFRHADITT